MITRLFSLTLLFFIPFYSFAQNLPADFPSGTIIFEGEVLEKESVRSTEFMEIPSIYTINWFSLDVVYDGQIEETVKIPILTIGGTLDGEFVIPTHSISFEDHYKYITAVEPCIDCVEGLTVYMPVSFVAEFQKEEFLQQRNLLTKRTRAGRKKECEFEKPSILYLSFGNIDLSINGLNIEGVIEVRSRTNEAEKMLVNLETTVEYDTNIFGENVVQNQVIQPTFASSQIPFSQAVAQSYGFQSDNLLENRAKFSLTRNTLSNQENFIVINTILQPTMVLEFSLPISALSNLPNALDNLIAIKAAEASFFCDGRETLFEEIIIEDHPIGVSFNGGGNDEEITYSFGNIVYNEPDNTYTFQVLASSSNPTRLRSGSISINYNPEAFTPFQTPTSPTFPAFLPIPQINNTGESSFEISFTDNDTDINEFQEISENTFLFSVTLAVSDCTQSADLSFNIAEMDGLSTYVEADNIGLPIVYQNVFGFDVETRVLCCSVVPEITGFDPAVFNAGDAQIFTIKGVGFGEYLRGVNPSEAGSGSSVLFHNGGFFTGSTRPEFIAAAEHDFIIDDVIKWTDTEIQVRVSSKDFADSPNNSPGSGIFKVRNQCNETTPSIGEIRIPYSLNNKRIESDGRAYRVGLRNSSPESTSNGYVFEFDPSIVSSTSTIDIQSLFGEALERWCERTEVNFKKNATINDTPIPNAPTNDGKNTVSMSNITGNTGGFTSIGLLSGQFQCGINTNSLNAGFIVTEIDIVLDDGLFTNQPAGIREVIMHELGHAQMLNHAWCEGEEGDCLMFPKGSNTNGGVTDPDADGANRVNNVSDAIINQSGTCLLGGQGDPISGISPIIDVNCGDTNGTAEVDLSTIKLYPNPTGRIVRIEEVSEFSEYALSNSYSHIIQRGGITGDFLSLDLKEIPSGAYILMLSNDSQFGYIKIIKI